MRKRGLFFLFIIIYALSTFAALGNLKDEKADENDLTAMCISNSLPAAEINEAEDIGVENETDAIDTDATTEKKSKNKTKKNTGDPLVLIYHTHATESYLPSSSGNYHTTSEKNTVRDAGNVLEKILEDKGIGVIHDCTLHDNPSYDKSYSRSFETVKSLLKKYPSIKCIIDLHRDATAAEIDGPTEIIKGEECAVYSYVLSNTTETYGENRAFLSKLNDIAAKDFDGFTGEILERPYWYNQEICGKAILIELGNNRNNIEEVRKTAKLFGQILAESLS